MSRRRALLAVVPALLAAALVLWFASRWGRLEGPPERDLESVPAAALDGPEQERARLEGREGPGPAIAPVIRFPEGTWPSALDRVDRLRDLHGVVVTNGGVPVAGARVTTEFFPWRRGGALTAARYDDAIPGPDARTADDGSFGLRLALGETVDMNVEASGYAAVRLRDRRAGERVRVVLGRGATISVMATLPEGPAAAGVRLDVRVAGAPVQKLVTDAEGRARSAPVPVSPEVTLTVAVQPGYDWQSEEHQVPEREGEHAVALVVRRARTVTGRVTDQVTGLPLADAAVGVGWMAEVTVRTDADGRYELACWPSNGYHDICVLAAGYARRDVHVGDRTVVDVGLVRGCELVGRVLGPDGLPYTPAAVVAMGSEHGGTVQRLSLGDAVTDTEGHFTVQALAHDLAHRVVVRADGVGRRVLLVPAIGRVGAVHDLGEIRLTRGRTIAGRVLDAEGGGQAGAEVRLVGPAEESHAPGGATALSHDYGRSDETRADDLGRFRFADLEPGRYVLMAVEREPVRTSRDVDLPSDADRLEETLTLPPRRRLRFEPVDDQGQLVVPVQVWLRWEGGRREDGIWNRRDLDIVLPGTVRGLTARVHAIGGHGLVNPEPMRVEDDATHARVVFRRVPVAAGRLLDEQGRPLARALVSAWRDAESIGSATTDADGTFRLGVEGTGLFDLRFEGRVYGVTEDSWFDEVARPIGAELRAVRPGATGLALLARSVPADRALEIRVLDPDGAPAGDVSVRVTPRKEGVTAVLRTDVAGRLALTELPPAHLSIRVELPEERRDAWWSPRLVSVFPDGQTVTLRLLRPRLLEGTVVTSKGVPLPGATVRIEFWDETSESRQADAQGRFRLPLAPDGNARVDLEAFSEDGAGTRWRAEAVDVLVGGAPVRLVAEPHDGIVR